MRRLAHRLLFVAAALACAVICALVAEAQTRVSRGAATAALPFLNVKQAPFSAKGDGVTDDSAALQSAIASAGAAGVELLIPGGTYIAKNVAISAAVSIRGAGRELVTIRSPVLAALDGSPILNITAAGVAIRGITFDGQKASQPADGFSDSFNTGLNGTGRAYRGLIVAYNAASEIVGLTVEDCALLNAYGAGIAAQNVSHAKIRRNVGNGNNFETVELYSTTAAGGATYYSGSEVVDNDILNTGSGDATINGNGIVLNHASEFTVAHNVVQNTERSALKCEGCKNGVVRGNTFGTITIALFAAIQLQQDASDIVVDSNSIFNVSAGINNGFVAGATGYHNVSITNNVIDAPVSSSQPHGIVFTFAGAPTAISNNITIANNTMTSIQGVGIYVASGAWTDVAITGNNIKTTAGGANGQYGIKIGITDAGTGGLLLAHNIIDLNGALSNGAGISFNQGGAQTLPSATIIGNIVWNQAGRTTITDGNVNVIASGAFGGNVTDGFIRMGSLGLQGVAPSVGGFTAGFQLAGMQGTAVTFANLGTPVNGSLVYCSNCTIANPCATGGTGALAKRLNGVWVCN